MALKGEDYMKILMRILVATLLLVIVFAISVNAEEPEISDDKGQSRFVAAREEMLAQREAKAEEREATAEARAVKVQERKEVLLSTVEAYSPDMTDDFESAFTDHGAVHEALQAIKTSAVEAFRSDTQEEIIVLKEALQEGYNEGNITKEEFRIGLKEFKETVKVTAVEERDAFKASIEDLLVAEKEAKEVRTSLRTALKVAVEANDSEAAVDALEGLYDNFLDHIQFDYDKLEALNNYLGYSL